MRVDRTFAFVDLCGFTAYTESHGDDAAVAVLARLRAVLRATTERRGVRITKWLGDGAMLSGIEPDTVMACAAEIRDEMADSPLPLRGGIARGPVIMFEGDDYVGAVVNLAARLCRAAHGNQLLAAATVDPLGARLPTRELEDMALDGLDMPIAVVEILPAYGLGARR
jgi:class 3 adenylate cyclase